MTSDQAASMELPRGGDDPAGVSAKKLRRVMRAVYLVLVKKHQPKLAALGVHLHDLLTNRRNHRGHHGLGAAREHSSLTLWCRTMDSAAAVVHPLPRDHSGPRVKSSRPAGITSRSSLSCRSMDPADAVHQYQYRPREVQFSFKSTPQHKRRRAQRYALDLHHGADDQGRRDHHPLELEHHGSAAAAVTRLFELMDAEEVANAETDADSADDGDLDLETAASSAGPSPRQVRITDSPFLSVREEEDDRLVDRRADEFITWFHEQLRTQQQRAAVRERRSYYWNR